MKRIWKYLVIVIWVTVFSTISISTCQETFYIFLLDYQYPCLAHFLFITFSVKEAFSGFLLRLSSRDFLVSTRVKKMHDGETNAFWLGTTN